MQWRADQRIATDDDPKWAEHNIRSLVLIVSTYCIIAIYASRAVSPVVTDPRNFRPSRSYREKWHIFSAFALITKRAKIGRSTIGSRAEIRDILGFTAKEKVKPWINAVRSKDQIRQ